uniref:G-protein coupled receptors family 1 profile domain-containing protein n=1 Tax=Plectus sambesii TaxID=2011161 RepID=A0A914XKR2_9BILA
MSLAANISATLNIEPDSVSAIVLGIWYLIQAIIGVPANLLLIWLWYVKAELRNVPSNIFIVNGALADAAYLLSSGVFNLHWGLANQLGVCKIGGFLTYFLALYGFSIPPFLAINRDVFIRRVSTNRESESWKHKLFSQRGTIIMSGIFWLYIFSVNIPFVFLDMYGRDALGICGIVYDLPVSLFVQFYICMLGTFFTSVVLTIVYYRRLDKWIGEMTRGIMSDETTSAVRETERLVKMTKWLTMMPVVCTTPGASLNFFLRFFPQLVNVRVARLVMIPFNFTSLANPFITLYFMKPFRNALTESFRAVRSNAVEQQQQQPMKVVGKRHSQPISCRELVHVEMNIRV